MLYVRSYAFKANRSVQNEIYINGKVQGDDGDEEKKTLVVFFFAFAFANLILMPEKGIFQSH